MPNLVDQIVITIKRGLPEDLPVAFSRAGFFFEKGRGLGRNLTLEEQTEELGWPSDIAHEKLYKEDIDRLKKDIMLFIRKNPEHPHLSHAVDALGKLHDRALRNFFIDVLQSHLKIDPPTMSSAMIALDDIGECVFRQDVDYSSLAVDDYRNVARAYLKRVRP